MNRDPIVLQSELDRGVGRDTANQSAIDFRRNTPCHVTVISTTPKGTLSALRTAARVAKNLDVPITLAIIEVLRPHLPLNAPQPLIDHIEKRAFALISDAGIREQAVTIQIWFCHDRNKCLRQALGPRTIVVVGGTKSWLRPTERKLEEWLCREGIPTIFADVDAKPFAEMLPKSHRHAVLHRVLNNPDKKIASPEGN